MSTASAFRGDTYRTRRRVEGSFGGSVAIRSSAHRNAARVLPEPVGATTSVSWPETIEDHAARWAAVGSANASRNHVEASGENEVRGSALTGSILSAACDTRARG